MSSTIVEAFDPRLSVAIDGGVPTGSVVILAGQPGTGKSIFVQHWLFHFLRSNPTAKTLYLTTLSEPPAKTIRYIRTFGFFDSDLFQARFLMDDIGLNIHDMSLSEIQDYIVDYVSRVEPTILVVDSFKSIRDFTTEPAAFRQFVYQFSVRLSNLKCTTFLVGEYSAADMEDGAEFAVADGIIALSMREQAGELQRVLRVSKMRGRNPVRIPIPFGITVSGIEIHYVSGVHHDDSAVTVGARRTLGIPGLDAMLTGGLTPGTTILVSGASGTGKTTLALQAASTAALEGQRVIYYSFEESARDLLATARMFGWELENAIADGTLRIDHTPQTQIQIERELSRIESEVRRDVPVLVVMDSFSVFLYRVSDLGQYREKMYQMRSLLSAAGAIGLLLSDIPATSGGGLSRMGVEETLADGVIVLNSNLEGHRRLRFVEVYKLRRTPHVRGQQRMTIGADGMEVSFESPESPVGVAPDTTIEFKPVREMLGGDLRYDSAWLIRGEPGSGKTTLAMQFAAEGLASKESALIVTADAPERDARARLSLLGVDVGPMSDSGQLRVLDCYTGNDPLLDLTEFASLVHKVNQIGRAMKRPLRIVFDSITPFSVLNDPAEFVRLMLLKNRILRQPNVALFDTHLYSRDNPTNSIAMLNGYDIVLDLYTTESDGDLRSRELAIAKVRDVSARVRVHEYQIEPGHGIVLE